MKTKTEKQQKIWMAAMIGFAVAIMFAQPQTIVAQTPWTTSGNNIYNTNTGNVGIGTSTPQTNVHISTSTVSTWSDLMGFNTNAAIAMEGTTPTGAPPGNVQHFNTEFLIKYQNSGTAIPNNFQVFRAIPIVDSSVSTNFTGAITGFSSQPHHNGTGTVSFMKGFGAGVYNMNTGTITNAYAYQAISPTLTGTGTITSAFGLEIDPQKVAGVTTGYGIYQAGSSDFNFFAGNVGIGTSAPDSVLSVSTNAAAPPPSFASGSPAIIHVTSADSMTGGGLFVDSFAGNGAINFRRADNTNASPSALATDDVIGTVNARGYNGSAYSSNQASFQMRASQAWTASALGTYMIFNTTLNGTTANTERMRIDNAGNVGIGTTAPTAKLDVAGTVNATGLSVNGSAITGSQWANGTGNINYGGGNVGIGTPNPNYKLDVSGSINATGGLNINNSPVVSSQWGANTVGSGINYSGSGTVGIGMTNPNSNYKLDVYGAINASAISINGSPVGSGGSQWTTSGSTINYSTGNVGIGTSAPDSNLTINANATNPQPSGASSVLHIAGADSTSPSLFVDSFAGSPGFIFRRADNTNASPTALAIDDVIGTVNARGYNGSAYSSNQAQFQMRASQAWTTSALGTYMLFSTTPNGSTSLTERMRIDNAGNVGIGTTAPGYKLDVIGQINAQAISINGSPVGTGGTQWANGSGSSSGSIYYTTGKVGIGTPSPNYALDVTGSINATGGLNVLGSPIVSSQWGTNTNGSGINYNASGYVGIGTPNPNYKLDVSGSINATGGLNVNGNVGIGTTAPTSLLHVVGNGRFTGNLQVDGNIAAKYQDVAEWVPAREQISAGTVVVLDVTKSNQVTASTQAYDTRVAGVVSAQPGISLGERGDNKVLVATTGRVRVKVDASHGPIHIGDLLVTSDIPGVAMKSEPANVGGRLMHMPGTLIGKALEPLEKGSGEISVLLSLQ
jgi:hypothetical protein